MLPEFSVGSARLQYSQGVHSRLVSEAAAMFPLAQSFIYSDDFRELQTFYCGGVSVLKRSNLLITRCNLVDPIIATRYKEAFESGRKYPWASKLISLGFAVAVDGWVSWRRQYYEGSMITRPGCAAMAISLVPIGSEDLDGVAVSKDWENMILRISGKAVGAMMILLRMANLYQLPNNLLPPLHLCCPHCYILLIVLRHATQRTQQASIERLGRFALFATLASCSYPALSTSRL